MEKIVVIGIDGATPDLIFPWIKEGKLPNFKKIMDNGSWGELCSTIPPFSAPAWTSIITGCNPGKHGIYGFEDITDLDTRLITSRNRRVPAIWKYLSDINFKNIVVNVPVTYPPEKINGMMITGLLTPSPESNFTYPKDLKNRLNKNDLGEYNLESIWLEDFPRSRLAKHDPEKLLEILNNQMESRAKVTIKLMGTTQWNFTMVVLRATDTAQHFLFHRKELLLQCYQKVDELVGKIMNTEPNATFFILSDHGFQKIEKILHPDNLLYKENYLKPTKDPYDNFMSPVYDILNKITRFILETIPHDTMRKSKLIKNVLFTQTSKNKTLDFSKTKAFCISEGRGIQINLKGRYKGGIIKKEEYENLRNNLIKLFTYLKDPETGGKYVKNAYKGNELYGKNACKTLDIILDLERGYSSCEGLRLSNSFTENLAYHLQSKKIPYLFNNDSSSRSGDHAQYGIFFAYGKNIKSNNELKNISVMDLLPHIFATFELSYPKIIDGKINENIFKEKKELKDIDWNGKKSELTEIEKNKIKELKNKLKKLK